MKAIATIALLFGLITPTLAQTNNAGFVQGLWYDRNDVFVDEPVRIYVAIRNNTGADLSGSVTFFINDKEIARKSVAALDGRIVESWADWVPTYGEHSIRAELSRLELSTVDGTETRTRVTASLADDILFVDYDTDDDGIGNEEDPDDDGDGISDEDEIRNGTDPLVYNEPETNSEETSARSIDTEAAKETDSTSNTATTGSGLETYLTPSRAQSLFAGITDWSQETKRAIDTLRDEQSNTATTTASSSPSELTTTDGFGEVQRVVDEARKPAGFAGDVVTFIGTIISGVIAALLAMLSWALSYPMLIQLLLLFAILIIIFKVAKKLGGRPSS